MRGSQKDAGGGGVLMSKSKANKRLSAGSLAATPSNCDHWLHGCSNKRPKKWSWNRRRNIGNQCGIAGAVLEAVVREMRERARRKSGTLHLAHALNQQRGNGILLLASEKPEPRMWCFSERLIQAGR